VLLALLRMILYWLIEWPIITIYLGIWARHRERMPRKGPAILIANHNSHLDVAVIRTLCFASTRGKLRPVGASDYFLSNPLLRWFSLNIIRIIPLDRKGRVKPSVLFQPITDALEQNEIVLIFPEGTRGDPEEMAEVKRGIAHVAQRNPNVPIIPVFLHGLGKALPRGEALFIPLRCDAFVGEEIHWEDDRETFMSNINNAFDQLKSELPHVGWLDSQPAADAGNET
jgi:1-acyl-sn-glycerol-3-phosphate acyltransferase